MNFKLKSSKTIFRGRVFDLKVDEIIYNSGNPGIREVAIHNGGAVIVPVTEEGKIIFIRQFRYPLQMPLLELPAGKLEKGEDPFVCAVRELQEETGYTSDDVTFLGSIFTTPGFCTEELFIYMAKNLIPGKPDREEGEQGMEVFEYSLKEISQMIKTHEIKDAKTISGIYMTKLVM